ncbi:MAG: AtpZ/AtpI family protein [Parachlamydiaceae bacterium]
MKEPNRARLIGLCVTLPFVLSVPPIVGWAIGSWLDGKLGTSPYLMYAFIVLGAISGIREFIRLVKKVSE